MKEKEIPLEERIEKIFESGWVNEFNYLENLMQETRSCLYKLQQELQRKDNIINECAGDILKELKENNHLSYGVALSIRQKLISYKEIGDEIK